MKRTFRDAHDIDYARWVFGEPDSMDTKCLPDKLNNHDYVSALWKYNEILLSLQQNNNIVTLN